MADEPIRPDYESQTIRITDLAVTDDLIQGKIFSNCMLVGPAMLAPLDRVTLAGCSFDVANDDPESILIVVPNRWLVGVIGLKHCSFFGCRFTRIGFVVDEGFANEFVSNVKGKGT